MTYIITIIYYGLNFSFCQAVTVMGLKLTVDIGTIYMYYIVYMRLCADMFARETVVPVAGP